MTIGSLEQAGGLFSQRQRAVILWRALAATSPAVSVVTTLLLLAACQAGSERQGLGYQWIDALNSRDAERVIGLMAPTATLSNPMSPPLTTAELRIRLHMDGVVWKERKYLAQRIIANDKAVFIEWQLTQTYVNGVDVPLEGLTVLETHDGIITAAREYYNSAAYLRVLTPPPAQ